MSNLRPVSSPSLAGTMLASLQLLDLMPPKKIGSPGPASRTDWIADRASRIAGAIAYLGTLGIVVSVADRHADIRAYFVSANRRSLFAEEVIEMAIERGWAE